MCCRTPFPLLSDKKTNVDLFDVHESLRLPWRSRVRIWASSVLRKETNPALFNDVVVIGSAALFPQFGSVAVSSQVIAIRILDLFNLSSEHDQEKVKLGIREIICRDPRLRILDDSDLERLKLGINQVYKKNIDSKLERQNFVLDMYDKHPGLFNCEQWRKLITNRALLRAQCDSFEESRNPHLRSFVFPPPF
jgi:hypothetical protein